MRAFVLRLLRRCGKNLSRVLEPINLVVRSLRTAGMAGWLSGSVWQFMAVTKKSDLHTDTPLWSATPRTSPRSHNRPLKSAYDVVIVGAGISGALMASALSDGARKVLVIDRRKPVGGSSLASTAMIQHEIDVPLSALVEKVGERKAKRVWSRSMESVAKLAERVRDAGIRCGFERKQTLFLNGDEMGWRALKAEAELRAASGFEATFLDGTVLRDNYGLDRTGAVLTNCSASANPAQMTAGFLRESIRKGAELVCGIEVTDVACNGGEVTLTLSSGTQVTASNVVFCTGYEFLKRLAHLDHEVISTWAIATKPDVKRPEWLDRFLVWEASDPYLYLRTTTDGRIVAGGEDEADEKAHLDKKKLQRKAVLIAKKVGSLLGQGPVPIDYCWAGPFGITPDGLPIIGDVPGLAGVFTVMGFGGNGITFSQIASEIIAARIAGHVDPDEGLFAVRSHGAARHAA
jgi:glycine/D-amino acid oxidase-like deaminating enzyme